MNIFKSFYNRDFYNNAIQNWKAGKILIFLLILFVLYGIISFIPPIAPSGKTLINIPITLDVLKNTANNPINKLANELPENWEITKDKGIAVYDKNNNPITRFKHTLFSINLEIQNISNKYFTSEKIIFTKQFIYIKDRESIRQYEVYNKILNITKDKILIKAAVHKNNTGLFPNISISDNNKILYEITFNDVKKLILILTGLIISLIIFIGIPLVFIIFIAWKALLALILTSILILLNKFIKKNLDFSNIFMTAILIQSWYFIFFTLNHLFNIKFLIFVPTILVLVFGIFVIVKFLDNKGETND